MAAIGAPLSVHRFDDLSLRPVYEKKQLLLRPDLHVCWRGDTSPENPTAVARRVTGHEVVR
ncbi:MAG: hypothetical protein IAI49_02280 [Candidatus Eremiobacteraeota bacterium]|nr:hypothetical protein [Candidatus Eremiobacteraeota bacterium]